MSWFSRKQNNVQAEYQPQLPVDNILERAMPEQNYESPRPIIQQEDFVDLSDPNTDTPKDTEQPIQQDAPDFNYKIGFPIDSIYSYIEKDWEMQGQRDCIVNSDISNMKTKANAIEQGLLRRIELVTLEYTHRIRVCQSNITALEEIGSTMTVSTIKSRIETYIEHLNKIKEIETKFRNNDPSLRTMTESYERGFRNGIATKATEEM